MEYAFNGGLVDVQVNICMFAMSDKVKLKDIASEKPQNASHFGFESIFDMSLMTSVGSMYPTGEVIIKTQNIDAITKLALEHSIILSLDIQTKYGDDQKSVKKYNGNYIVSGIHEMPELSVKYSTTEAQYRFYDVTFDSIRKYHLFGQCTYSTFACDEQTEPIEDIVKNIFGEIGIQLKTDWFLDKTKCKFITSNNATVRSAFQYLMRRTFKMDDSEEKSSNSSCCCCCCCGKSGGIDIPMLVYDHFGNDYELVSFSGLSKRMQERAEKEKNVSRKDTWAFMLSHKQDNVTGDWRTGSSTYSLIRGSLNQNDFIRQYYDRLFVDYDPELDGLYDNKTVKMNSILNALYGSITDKNDIPIPKSCNFVGEIDHEFPCKSRRPPLFVSSTFRENIFTHDFIDSILLKSDRLNIETGGNMYRTVGDIVDVHTSNNSSNTEILSKLVGLYVIGKVTHHFYQSNNGPVFTDSVELISTTSKQPGEKVSEKVL